MTKPAATRAVYADYRRVKGRKVHQVVFEIPSELWPQAYAVLGEPNIDTSDWYGIAKLRPEIVVDNEEKWQPDGPIHPATECALVCQKPTFWEFIRECQAIVCDNEEDAATYVRRFCHVNTRADLATNDHALQRWQFLQSAYLDWLPKRA